MSNMLVYLERAAREDRRRHRQPVVGDRDAAGRLELGDVGELLALLPARHRADRIDARQARLPRAFCRISCVTPALSFTGFVFGMHATAVKPPATADGHAGRHRFLVLLARLAQVHVHVDEAGTDDQPRRQIRRSRRRPPFRFLPTSAMRSPSISTSKTPSLPLAGSTTRPPLKAFTVARFRDR